MITNLKKQMDKVWNIFKWDESRIKSYSYPTTSYVSSPREYSYISNGNRTILDAIYTRISVDVASLRIEHVEVDENGRYINTIHDSLNNCLTHSANVDQTAKAFIQDIVLSLFDEGSIAVVPIDVDRDPMSVGDLGHVLIESMRVARIVQWYPRHVRVDVYDDRTGEHHEIDVDKRYVAIIENPFYLVMNKHSSTASRLSTKISMLDKVDYESTSGRLDMIIQLSHGLGTVPLQNMADQRRSNLETQLSSGRLGIGYIGVNEKVVQLNRSIENSLLPQIDRLTEQLFNELGMTRNVFNGTATEDEKIQYYSGTVEVVISAIVDAFSRTFLSSIDKTNNEAIMYFRDPFKLASLSAIAEAGDSLTRNEILSSNDMRSVLGYKPSKQERADELVNKNIAPTNEINQNGKDR